MTLASFPLQTLQKVESDEEGDSESVAYDKSQLIESSSRSGKSWKKNKRSSSFAASEGKEEEAEKFRHDLDLREEVGPNLTCKHVKNNTLLETYTFVLQLEKYTVHHHFPSAYTWPFM